ncbi:MAG: hypothetical protein J7K39_05155 [Bacteroidales bacterium]|nr:hypothetical protein [Bacteroidales bacterium]RLD36807.1 MAG: hypothetical protein DRI74_08355 [Bacteroidota bacterium]
MERLCLYCQEPISGRIDKKFCSDQCRNAYNNEKNATAENHVRRINGILRKNRKLLEDTSGKINKKVISIGSLTNAGFNFNYYTSSYTTKKGHIYYFCYEYGYLKLGENKVMIIKRDNFDN